MTGRARDAIDVPPGYLVQLCIRGAVSFVVIAPEGMKATPEAMVQPGHISALLTQGEGVSWPDRTGVIKANDFLAQGWVVLLSFETLADALACRTRLAQERVQ